VLVLAAALLCGLAALLAFGDGDRRDEPAAGRSNPGVVAARPVPPRPAGREPRSVEVLRVRPPGGGEERVVTMKRVIRDRGPAAFRRVRCLDSVAARNVATRRFQASGGCAPVRDAGPRAAALAYSRTSGLGVDSQMSGFAPPGTRRLTLAGAGPTIEIPLGRHGAWFVLLAEELRATLTLTAELADGGTRFERVRFPMGPVPPDALEVRDPVDGSTWSVMASRRAAGIRSGQTCVQFFQLDGRGREKGFGAPMCGDLRREPLFVDALERGPGPQTKFGGGPHVEPRMVVWGAASRQVRELRVEAAGATHEVAVDDAGGFILVLPSSVRRDDVTVAATLADGSERTWQAPDRAGTSRSHRAGVRVTSPLRARVDRPHDRILLTMGVAGRPDRVKVNFESHPTYLRRTHGDLHRGTVRFRHGLPRHYDAGDRFGAQAVICAPGCLDSDAGGVLR
jgi:hypothetical protein